MATAEGVFPKEGGDPIYASELNSFGAFGGRVKYIGSIAGGVVDNSTTETQVGGSIVIPSGTYIGNIFAVNHFRVERDGFIGGDNLGTVNIKIGTSGAESSFANNSAAITQNGGRGGGAVVGLYPINTITGSVNIVVSATNTRQAISSKTTVGDTLVFGY